MGETEPEPTLPVLLASGQQPKIWSGYAELSLRWTVAILIATYGGNKVFSTQFKLPQDIYQMTLDQLPGHQLLWFFFAYSRPYELLIGLLQLAGALLLLLPRTMYLGLILLFPILINIVLLDCFYHLPPGTLGNSAGMLLLLLLLIWLRRSEVLNLLKQMLSTSPALPVRAKPLYVVLGIALCLGFITLLCLLLNTLMLPQ